MGESILYRRSFSGMCAAGLVVLFMTVAMLLPAVSLRAEPLDVTDTPVMCVEGQTVDAVAGKSVAFLDIDHDGVGDLVVGSPGDSSEGASSGKVMIYLGDVIETDPDIVITGSAAERFGASVARAGDVNSDGIEDLVVGAPSNDSGGADVGAAYIFFGSEDIGDIPDRAFNADVVIAGVEEYGSLGYAVSTAGDADLDGDDDVIVGAPYADAGYAYLVYGGPSMDGTPDKTFSGSTSGDQFGFAVAGGENLDGSAQPDVVVGAPLSSSKKGAVQVILNPAKATPKVVTLQGASIGDKFGTSVALLDYNGDIYGDVAVGAPNANSVGEVSLYYGSSTAGKFDKTADVEFSIGLAGDMFGLSVAAGDPRTDGTADLLVGAPMNDTAGIDAGRAYVFYGNATADAVPDVVVEGAEGQSRFGWAVASGNNVSADYNDDLAADFAVGAPNFGEENYGAAYLYLGIRIVLPANPTVYGYVLDSVTSEGLSNALVTMEGPSYSRSVRTTANGSYGLTAEVALPPGTYWINASYPDYFDGSGQHALTLDTRTNVSFDLDRLPIVQGVITDGNASGPLEGALVEVTDSSENLLDSLTTDATGEYYFMLEVVDDITITVTKEYYFDGVIECYVEGNSDLTEDLILDHYPILIFTAEDTDEDPIEGVDVEVEIDGELVATDETSAFGDVTIMVPEAGSAYVNSSRAGFVPDSSEVDLFENEITTLDIVMDRQPSITGMVKDELFEAPVPGAEVELREAGMPDLLETAVSESDGSYTFPVVEEGTYDLRVVAIGYLVEYRLSVDIVADEAATEDFWLQADTIPPTSEISDPQPGLLFITPEITVYANASDPNGNEILAVGLYYSHEGKPYKVWGALDTEAPYVFEFDASEANGDGVYEFYTIAWDCARNKQVTPVSNDTWIIMNSGVPVSEVDVLDPYQSTATFTVDVTGSDPFGVDYVELWYSYEGGAFDLYGQDDEAPYSWEFVAADGDGEYAFYSILVNDIGQTELPPDEPDTSTLLDTVSPTSEITAPEDDEPLGSGTVSLEATLTDAGAGLDYVTYEVDSEDAVTVEIDDGEASYGLSVELELEDGEHSVTVTAADLLGWETSDEVTFTVDTEPPTLTILAPVDGSAVNTVDVEVSWSVEDDVSGVATIEARFDGGSWEVVTGTSVLYEGLDDDTYTFEIRATDAAGNVAPVESTTFEVDTFAPTVYITDPEEGELIYSSTVTVRWEQSDIGSGLETVEARLDGGDWEVMPTNVSVYEGLSDGIHAVDVRATDLAGNDDTDTVTFEVVDSSAPEISITSPADDSVLPVNSVTFEWSVTDEGTGIDTVEYKLDAEAWTTTTAIGTLERTDLAEGAHTFSIRATDNADNTASLPVQFTVDTLDPTVAIDSPADGETVDTADVLIEYTVDGTGTTATVERSVDGGAWEPAGMASTLVESLSEGAHTVDIRATDEAGHEATDSVGFTVDLGVVPTVTITAPGDGAVIPEDSVTVTWTIENPAGSVEVQLDDGAWVPVTGDSTTFEDLSDGEHTVTVRTTQGGEDSVTFTVDTTPPTVSISSPADDAVIDSASVVVTWTSTDAVTTERKVDGGDYETVTGTSTTVSSLADGEHTVEIRVTDIAGHQASDTVTVIIDTTAPSVEITAPLDGASMGTELTVQFTTDDGAGSGVETVEVRMDAGDWLVATGGSHTFSGLIAGEHTVDVRATDFAGNYATDSVTFTVEEEEDDTTAPSLSITSPANGTSLSTSSVTVTWTASDAGSGVATIEVKLDSGVWTTVTGSSREFATLTEGSHTVSVRVTDNAGNEATASVTFMVDTVDPSLTIDSPEDGMETEETSVTITWTCTDTGCGIERIEVRLDDGSYVSVGTDSERTFSDLAVGEHTVDVRAYDKAGNMVEASVDFTVSEGGGGISGAVIAGIVLAIIVILVVAVVLMRRKKTPSPPME